MEETNIRKETPTDFDIHPLIQNRWSPRSFSDTPISESQVKRILEAGRWAPSSYNRQPWRIIYGLKGDGIYERITDCLVEFNQSWTKNAPVLMLGCYKKTTERGDINSHALHDLGLFMATATLQAQHNGVAMHQMAGIDSEKARKEFGFPEDYEVATAIAMGYYGGDPDTLSDDLKKEEMKTVRERKTLNEFVFNGDFKEK